MSALPAIDSRDVYPAILATTEPEVRTRIRIAHSRTQRDGWQYETTVEVEYDGTDDIDAQQRLATLMHDARFLAERERDDRNKRDGKGAP